mmetsp:Transcript_70596/g.169143  ORF Transcript_70596/g.169143 Transcript_70596/m.169143 type:complete len:482 (+) Transcript_70596:106-1551(+)
MGNNLVLADNQSVSYENGASRLCKSFVVAFCVAPLVILLSMAGLGWNEQQSVCNDKVIIEGSKKVNVIGCEDIHDGAGELVLLNCDIQKTMPPLSGSGAFNGMQHVGTGLRYESEMFQCVEHEHSETRRTSAGGKETITTYSYSTEWVKRPVNSNAFHKRGSSNWQQNCGVDNPSWPSDVPQTGERYVSSINVGAFKTRLVTSVPLDTGVPEWPAPAGWSSSGAGAFSTDRFLTGTRGIGQVRVRVFSNDWSRPQVTVLGQNNNGLIEEWMGSSSWLCHGFTLNTLRMGTLSASTLFQQLSAEESAFTWFVRIAGFVALWVAFACCFAPLGVAADCVPCIGGCLSESVECITCCFACIPATSLCVLVCGVVWLVMRPLLGGALLAAGIVLVAFMGTMAARSKRSARSPPLLSGSAQQAPLAAPAMAAMPQQPAPVVRQMQVTVPNGCGPGSMVQVQTPDGITRQVVVPAGATAGSTFILAY